MIRRFLATLIVGKPMYQSLTVWGISIFTMGEAYCRASMEMEGVLLGGDFVCWVTRVLGFSMTALGIRRAQNPVVRAVAPRRKRARAKPRSTVNKKMEKRRPR